MQLFRFTSSAILVLGSLVSAGATNVLADSFHVSYLGAGVQGSSDSTYVENFSNFNGTTTFNGSPITGTYTGSFNVVDADMYGGADGTGKFITTTETYTLTLSESVNYFGMWFSALDTGNWLSFYNNDTLLFTFSPSEYATLVGDCPTNAPEPNFCGNPNSAFYNQDSNQQYAFLNFYDIDGSFNKIVFYETPQFGGFESDNHTLGNLSTNPGGTPVSPVPEPSTFVLGLSGLAGLAGTRHQLLARLRRRS